jgi:hypothetical protein
MSIFRIPLEQITLPEPTTLQLDQDAQMIIEKETPMGPERDSFVSNAGDIDTFENLKNFNDSALLIRDDPPKKKEVAKPVAPPPRLDTKILSWASS